MPAVEVKKIEVSENYARASIVVKESRLTREHLVKLIAEEIIQKLRLNATLMIDSYDIMIVKLDVGNYSRVEVNYYTGCWKVVFRVDVDAEFKEAEAIWWVESAFEPQSL